MNLTSFFSVGIDFFWRRFRKSTRNSSIRIKAVDVRFLTWSWDSLWIVYVVATAVCVVVTVDTWVVLILPWILGRWTICFRQMIISMWVSWMSLVSLVQSVLWIRFLMASRSICTFARTALILLCFGCWSRFIGCAARTFLLLQYTTAYMEGWLLKSKIILDIVLRDPVLRLSFTGLFKILLINSSCAWSLLMMIRVLIDFCGVIMLLGLYRALRLV